MEMVKCMMRLDFVSSAKMGFSPHSVELDPAISDYFEN